MYTISSFFKLMKKACINPAISNEEFVNSLLDRVIETFKLKGRNGESLIFTKSRVSDLLRNRSKIPANLQGIARRTDCKKLMIEIMEWFYEEMLDGTLIDQSILLIKEQIENADNIIAKQKEITKCDNRNEFLSEAFILAIKTENTLSLGGSQSIWKKGANVLDLVVGDLFKYGFDNRVKEPLITVIPVDDSFETRITKQTDSSCHPLVSEKTIHGNWLSRMYKCGYTHDKLKTMINNSIIRSNDKTKKQEGSELKVYPIGTIASIPHCGKTFYLLAISHFNDDGMSNSTKKDIEISIVRLMEYYNTFGQGYHLYLPLLGTGRSRVGLSLQESFDLIVRTILDNCEKMNGEISIVILPGEESSVSITRIGCISRQ